jgi:hypothetical protein
MTNDLRFNDALGVWEGTAPNGLTVRLARDVTMQEVTRLFQECCYARGITDWEAAWNAPYRPDEELSVAHDRLVAAVYTVDYWLAKAG